MATPLTDRELIAATLRDPHAFAAIVERYQAPIRRYVVRLGCTDPHDIEDVLQELFIKCYTNLNDYDPSLKFSSWLYRIAHNETVSYFRKKRIRPAPVVTEEDLKIFEQIPDESDLVEALSQERDAGHIREAIMVMHEKYRAPLLLRFFEEKSYTEISDILQIPEGTVATYISRGKKELKKLLSAKHLNSQI